jgi:hypothetical protein
MEIARMDDGHDADKIALIPQVVVHGRVGRLGE